MKFATSATYNNGIIIFLNTLLVSCWVLASLAGAQSCSKTQDISTGTKLSSPEECARKCYAGEPPKTCHYTFHLEFYTVLGDACQLCTPNDTNKLQENCQCVTADGVERTVMTVNRMIPGPSIEVCQGDRVVVDIQNSIDRMEVTIHWHGVLQKGSQYYDGVPFVTQCPIQEGNMFRYQWVAENAGTHFWHSHMGLQKMDGIYGSLIIREPECRDRSSHLYDEDLSAHVMVISDWMHELARERFPGLKKTKPGQIPESALINGKGRYKNRHTGNTTNTPLQVFTVKRGRRYRFRMINAFSSACAAQLYIQKHTLTTIATDGEPVHPVDVDSIISFPGERYDFVINADQPPGAYWIQLRGLLQCESNHVQQLAILRYEGGPDTPCSKPPTYKKSLPQGVVLNPLDGVCDTPREDAVCIYQLSPVGPVDAGILGPNPDVKLFLPINFVFYTPEELFVPKTHKPWLGTRRGHDVLPVLNGIGFTLPSSPPLSQIDDIPPGEFCTYDNRPADCGDTCTCTQMIDIPLNSIVEVILSDVSNSTELFHPFHLRGHTFNVIGIGRSLDKNNRKVNLDHVHLNRRCLPEKVRNAVPFKDTIAVPNQGYVVLRFRANNPGYWLLDSDILYHRLSGMGLILHVGTAKDLPPVPRGFPVCGNYLQSITSN